MIEISDQNLLSSKFEKLNLNFSEYTFPNVYLFRNIHEYNLLEIEKHLFIQGKSYDHHTFLMPTEKLYEIDQKLLVHLAQKVDFFFPLPEEWLKHFDPTVFQWNYSEADSDYLYLLDKMRTYEGRHLSKKRNLVKQLLQEHQVVTNPLTHANKKEALQVLEIWKKEIETNEDTDYEPCREAIEKLDLLKLEGLLFYVEDHPCGFAIGEKLNHETFVFHFAKACRHLKGLYQYIYQTFASTLDAEYLYLNLEQDLGNAQIKQAKHSYQPEKMVNKYRLWRR